MEGSCDVDSVGEMTPTKQISLEINPTEAVKGPCKMAPGPYLLSQHIFLDRSVCPCRGKVLQ